MDYRILVVEDDAVISAAVAAHISLSLIHI